MKFDLENLNPGTWFDFEDGGRICLRTLSVEESTAISKKTTKQQVEYKGPNRYAFDITDDDKAFSLMWDAVIVDWEGIESADGKPMVCDTENKLRLMRKSPVFARLVREYLEKLASVETTEKEAEEKN